MWCARKKSSNASLARSRHAWQNKRPQSGHLFFGAHQRRIRLRQQAVERVSAGILSGPCGREILKALNL